MVLSDGRNHLVEFKYYLLMKYTKLVAKPEYSKLVLLFDKRFEKVEVKEIDIEKLVYKTILRLKIRLRFDMNMNFTAKLILTKKGLLTSIGVSINYLKIIILSLIMFVFFSTISYLIKPSTYSYLFGLIAALIVLIIAKKQINQELKFYLKNLLDKNKA